MIEPETGPPGQRRAEAWPATYGALVVLAATALFFSMRTVLSPLILFPVFLLLLYPFVGDRRHRVLVIGTTLIFLLWALDTLGGLLTPFLLAAALAYILDPVCDWLVRRGLPRSAAILILALPVLGLLALLVLVAIPALIRQIDQLIGQVPAALERIVQWLSTLDQRLATLDLPLVDDRAMIQRIRTALDPQRIVAFIEARQGEILEHAWGTLLGVGRGFGAVLGILGYVVLTPVLLFYLLRDWDRIMGRIADLIPRDRREVWTGYGHEYDRLLARFLRGQLLAASIVGVLTWLGLWIVGFPMPGLVGAIAGVFNIVPYLGLIMSVLPVILIAIISGNVLALLLKAGIVFAIVQFIDGSVTGPRITGESVGIHPVWVIFALSVAGFAFGFAGLLIAMPLAVLVKLVLMASIERWKASDIYRGRATAETE